MLYVHIALFLLPPILLWVFLRWLRREQRRIVARYRAGGRDPEDLFIGAAGILQAQQKSRRRGPVAWFAMKYIQWTRRDVH
jgi:hypothetical protein